MFADVIVGGGPYWGYSLIEVVVRLLVICAIIAVAWVIATQAFGWTPPPWFRTVVLIVVACVIGVVAIKILASL